MCSVVLSSCSTRRSCRRSWILAVPGGGTDMRAAGRPTLRSAEAGRTSSVTVRTLARAVRDVRLPVGNGLLLGGETLEACGRATLNMERPRQQARAALVSDLQLFYFFTSEAERGPASGQWGTRLPTVSSSKAGRRGRCGTPRPVRRGRPRWRGRQKRAAPEPSGAGGATAPAELVRDVLQSSRGVHRVPAVNHAMPVPLSAAQAPVTPSIAQRPWITSRSAFFSEPKGMIRGLATAGVGAELGVDVGLDDLGHARACCDARRGGKVSLRRLRDARPRC